MTSKAEGKTLEERIDRNILKNPNGTIFIDTEGISEANIEAVKQKYEERGWEVQTHHNQRNGPSMSLKRRTA